LIPAVKSIVIAYCRHEFPAGRLLNKFFVIELKNLRRIDELCLLFGKVVAIGQLDSLMVSGRRNPHRSNSDPFSKDYCLPQKGFPFASIKGSEARGRRHGSSNLPDPTSIN